MSWGLVNKCGEPVDVSDDCGASAGRSILASLPEECRPEFLQLLREAYEDGMPRRLGITRRDQPLLVVDIVPLRLAKKNGQPALVVLSDSGEFDSSFERVRKLARRSQAILLSSMDGFFVADDDCRFLEVNESFCRMIGYGAEELLRMSISDLESVEGLEHGVPSHTRTGLHHFSAAHRHKDGHVVHLEISINVLHDDGEKILVGFARDVTERKRAAEERARLMRQQKLILDSAAEGIAGLNNDGHITFINPAAAGTLGYNAGELIGRSAHRVFQGSDRSLEDCDVVGCAICAVLRDGCGSLPMEGEFSRADGSRFPIEGSITSMRTEHGVIGAVLVFKNMTEQRRAEEERRSLEAKIQQSQKLESLGLLAGGIAHDLNNMLAGIQGNASLALSQAPGETTVPERLQRIVKVCQRASKVIRQILAYAGHVACDASPLSLNELVLEMKEFMRAAVPNAITLETRLDPGLPLVEADGGQLQQVITGLLVNAVEAIGGRSGGRITMSTECLSLSDTEIQRAFPGRDLKPGRYVRLSIEDTGCGMSSETMERIFEPFYSEKGPGRGLGLSAMHGVVRAHHGALQVESELGEGTRFTVVLPAMSRSVASGAPPKPRPRLRAGSTLLVIDDDDEVRDVIRDMLTNRGLKVLTAEDGARGVEVFKRHAEEIDVVLLDMMMPDKNGEEILPELLSIRPDATVIVSTGFSEDGVASQFSGAKPAGYVQKPFTPDALMDRIGEVLERRGETTNP